MNITASKLAGSLGLALSLAIGLGTSRAGDASTPVMATPIPVAPAFTQADLDKVIQEVLAKINAKAPAKDFDEILQEISNLVPAMGSQRDVVAVKLAAVHRFVAHWQDYQLAEERGEFAKASTAVAQLSQESEQMFTVLPRSRLLDLQSTVAAQLESSHKATMDTLVKHLGKAIDAAKAASDFDPVLSEIDAAQSACIQYDNSFGYSLQALRRYAGSWQELVALQSSASPKAKTALDALTRETSSFAGDFRAKVEARRASIPGAEEKVPVVVPVKVPEPLPDPAGLTLGNVEKYSKAFNQPRQGGQISSEDQVAASELMQVLNAKTKLMYQDPQPAIELYASRSYQPLGDYALPLAKVKSDLAIQALDFQFREIVPDAKDTVASYLKRVIATKIQAKDWQGVIDALQDSVVMSSTQGYLRQSPNADLAAFHSLQVGIHQEAAGQYSEAVESYLAALSSQGSLTPVDELSARLKAIQKNHPTEFADGTKAIAVHQQQAQEAMAAQVFARRAAEYGTPRGASPAGVSQPPAPVGTAPSPASH